MNANTVTREEILLFLASQPLTTLRTSTFHLAIAQGYANPGSPVVMDEKAIAEAIGVDIRQVRRMKATALEDGYWNIVGGNRCPSAYSPSPKLVAAVQSLRETKEG